MLSNGAFGSLCLAEFTLAMTVIGCALVEFNDAVSSDGMSYYGVHRKTIPILVLGLSLSIAFFLKAASRFDAPGAGHLISKALKFFSGAAITILLTLIRSTPIGFVAPLDSRAIKRSDWLVCRFTAGCGWPHCAAIASTSIAWISI